MTSRNEQKDGFGVTFDITNGGAGGALAGGGALGLLGGDFIGKHLGKGRRVYGGIGGALLGAGGAYAAYRATKSKNKKYTPSSNAMSPPKNHQRNDGETPSFRGSTAKEPIDPRAPDYLEHVVQQRGGGNRAFLQSQLQHPQASPELLSDVATYRQQPAMLRAVARHPNTRKDTLRRLSKSNNPQVANAANRRLGN